MTDKLRIDKWLWMTRFFKTRKLATAAVSGGKVHVNGQRIKPAFNIKISDVLTITRVQEHWEVTVTGIPLRRGPAKEAQTMFLESEESFKQRQFNSDVRKAERVSRPREEQRPDKHQRKQLRQLKHKE